MSKSIVKGSLRGFKEQRTYTAEHTPCDRRENIAHFGESRPLLENSKQSLTITFTSVLGLPSSKHFESFRLNKKKIKESSLANKS